MDGLREDTAIYPLIVELSSCLAEQMRLSGGPDLCYVGPMAGPLVMDYCGVESVCEGDGCGGQAWVRFVDAYPSSTFPGIDNALANCKSPFAYSLEVGVARCAPMGTSNASGFDPPTMEDHLGSIRLQTADVAAMRRAIQCCFGAGEYDYVMGQYDQTQVNGGGCIGGTFQVVVWERF